MVRSNNFKQDILEKLVKLAEQGVEYADEIFCELDLESWTIICYANKVKIKLPPLKKI